MWNPNCVIMNDVQFKVHIPLFSVRFLKVVIFCWSELKLIPQFQSESLIWFTYQINAKKFKPQKKNPSDMKTHRSVEI